MHYGEIKNCDIANGLGVRVTLFVSGCTNHCENCFQPQTWDFHYGKPFDAAAEQIIFNELEKPFIRGLTLLGGDPFEPENQRALVPFLRRVRERYAFMGGQKDDLERAQRELYRVIDRLTVNMKEIFASEFARLNVLFGQTFREIFGGGHAELALADTSDILSCGIDIRVSPPGKAVKTITLLSGGEKAFVAITLYFAILKLRPAPFCVLDEIEAALDDVNVQRYAKYIRKLTDFTQFIVITHRRGTMEEADMLYGVTMQEQGVSKLLMLNLAEAEKRLKNTIK